jgi:hypothetical protein
MRKIEQLGNFVIGEFENNVGRLVLNYPITKFPNLPIRKSLAGLDCGMHIPFHL